MNAIKIETTIDEAAAAALPALRPLLGQKVELIALSTAGPTAPNERTLSLDELLAHRIVPPPTVGPVSLDDMERAIARGARGDLD